MTTADTVKPLLTACRGSALVAELDEIAPSPRASARATGAHHYEPIRGGAETSCLTACLSAVQFRYPATVWVR